MNIPLSFETNRLHLRIPNLDDAHTIFDAYAQDVEVCRYMTWTPHGRVDTLKSWLEETISEFGKTNAAYILCPIDEPTKAIGMIDARIEGFKAEIGYTLSKDLWGQGLMTEALTSFIDLLLSYHQIYRVSAVCDVKNSASSKVMEKSGMSYEGILRRFIIHPNISNDPRDVMCYSKIK